MASIAPAAARAVVGASDGGGGGGLIISVTRSVLSNGRPAVVPRSRNQPDPSHRPNCPRATRPHPGRRFPQAKSCRNARFRAPESWVRLSAGARRGAGDRRGDGAGVPRRVPMDVGRLRRRVDVLHAVGVPDHEPALVEHDRSGRLDAGAFYARRVRRLLPASLVCLLGVMVAALGRPVPRRHQPAPRPLGRAGSGLQLGRPRRSRQLRPADGPGGRPALRRSTTTGASRSRSSSTGCGRWC